MTPRYGDGHPLDVREAEHGPPVRRRIVAVGGADESVRVAISAHDDPVVRHSAGPQGLAG